MLCFLCHHISKRVLSLKWIMLNVVAAVVSGVIRSRRKIGIMLAIDDTLFRSLNLRYYLKAQEAARLGKGGSELVTNTCFFNPLLECKIWNAY